MRLSIDFINEKYGDCIDHVILFLNAHPLKPHHLVVLGNADADIHLKYKKDGEIPSQEMVFSSTIQNELCANTYDHHQVSIYSVEMRRDQHIKPFYENARFGFDVIETIFFHITRYEEYHWPADLRNQWDMMPEQKQFLIRHELNHLPLVDHLVVQFFIALGFEIKNQKSSIILTHDIDYFSRFAKETKPLQFALSLLKRNPISLATYFRDFAQFLGQGIEPYEKFESLFEIRVQKKMIYFLYGGNHSFDALPTESRKRFITNMALKAKKYGYSIGLHPSYLSAINPVLFENEKNAIEHLLGQAIRHSRQHFLHFSFSDTVSILEKYSLEEDASIGYNENLGFRAGTGFRYKLFNWQNMSTSSVYEQPIAWMDSANWYSSNKHVSTYQKQAISFLTNNKYNTCISMLFHNSSWYDYNLYGVDFDSILTFMSNQERE